MRKHLARLTLVAVSACLCSRVSAQDFLNAYLPVLSLNTTVTHTNTTVPAPFSFDVNHLRHGGFYWSLNCDALIQRAFYEATERKNPVIEGGVAHFRLGYQFWNTSSNDKAGFAFDFPFRYKFRGAGITYFFFRSGQNDVRRSQVYLMPQLSMGKVRNSDDISNHGFYGSIEIDLSIKVSNSTGISIKPFIFTEFGGDRRFDSFTYGIKLGFSKFNMNIPLS